ncbi:MAG: ECF transporter S component [Oscillospiraceae bacterium]|nr:ECF transporter S component [Oscillospiraceae bacterium]
MSPTTTSRTARTKKLVTLAVLSTIAYVVMIILKFPVVLFLSYEPKDAIIALGGFLYGPLAAMVMSIIVAFVEMVTVSTTWIYGAVMNALSSCTFACTAAFVYSKKRTIPGAAIGLVAGVAVTVPVMLLWNYTMVPLYMGVPRAVVKDMLVPTFLPYNLLKYSISGAITVLLFKPISLALEKAKLMPQYNTTETSSKRLNTGTIIVSTLVLVSCILFILSWRGII